MEVPIDTLSITELVAGIEEIKHQIGHLMRSQKELKEVVLEDPDPEFVLAIEENEEVFVRKNASLLKFIEALRVLDSNTAGHYESSVIEKPPAGGDGSNTVVSSTEPSAVTVAPRTNNAVPGIFDADDGGMFL